MNKFLYIYLFQRQISKIKVELPYDGSTSLKKICQMNNSSQKYIQILIICLHRLSELVIYIAYSSELPQLKVLHVNLNFAPK